MKIQNYGSRDKTHREAADDFWQIMEEEVRHWKKYMSGNPSLDKWDFWARSQNIKSAVNILNRQLEIPES